MAKLPLINEIVRTIGRGTEAAAPEGITRRKFLQGITDSVVNKRNPLGIHPEEMSDSQVLLHTATNGLKFFETNPQYWMKEWGPIEDADPEDIADAFINVPISLIKKSGFKFSD